MGDPSEELVRRTIPLLRGDARVDERADCDCWTGSIAVPEVRCFGDRRLRPLRLSDLVVSAVMNTIMPAKCSMVQILPNRKKDRKSVVAFRAVLVMLMVRAPKFLVIAAEHDDPKKPILENTTNTVHFAATVQFVGSILPLSSYTPGTIIQAIPCRRSPLAAAAMEMAMKAIEYNRKMNYTNFVST